MDSTEDQSSPSLAMLNLDSRSRRECWCKRADDQPCVAEALWKSANHEAALEEELVHEVLPVVFVVERGSVEKVGVRALAAPVSDIRNQLIS